MSNRFVFFFLSTFVMLSVYYSFESTTGSSISPVDIFLETTLYIFDYILFVGYLLSKFIKNKKKSLLFTILAFTILIVYSYFGSFYLNENNHTTWTNYFFLFHISARTLIFLSFLLEIKIPRKFIPINILFNIILISLIILFEGQITSAYGGAIYKSKLYIILYILEIFILNLSFINSTKNKSHYYIFIISASVSLITDFVYIQNQIYFSTIFQFTTTRIFNTLAELGLVYSLISLTENTVIIKKKYQENDIKTLS